jgi:hypothetical protein
LQVEAFELVLEKMKHKVDLQQVKGISGSAQQHGRVFWMISFDGIWKRSPAYQLQLLPKFEQLEILVVLKLSRL